MRKGRVPVRCTIGHDFCCRPPACCEAQVSGTPIGEGCNALGERCRGGCNELRSRSLKGHSLF